ncbi:hypothetical protein ADL01_07265 [Streptomyces sp. NRRL WC-3618]|nr:hypothetical protein ADL01_07265 [Streptomyces sp. NRRL WC-3618]
MKPGQQFHGVQARRTEPRHVAHHHRVTATTPAAGPEQRTHALAEPRHLLAGDGAGQHEYSGCHGVHEG